MQGQTVIVQGRIDAVGEKAEEEQMIVSYIYTRTFPADSAPLLLPCSSSIEASKAATGQILNAALQITAKPTKERRKRSQCRGHVVTECNEFNLQIGSLQIDVHEPPVRLSQAVITIHSHDLHTRLVWNSVWNQLFASETRTQLRVNDEIRRVVFLPRNTLSVALTKWSTCASFYL